mmetsp:Transcript_8154/g.10750  ORF Transcript_8154/g.10750 Transcript_8154/m.10750 type:complete len:161 (-) Transcript_8154:294-776(-)
MNRGTLFQQAILNSDVNWILNFVQRNQGPSLTTILLEGDSSGNNALHFAVLNNRCAILKLLMQHAEQKCFWAQNNAFSNVLHLAAMENLYEATKILLENPCITVQYVNLANPITGNTALHWAAIHGNELLMDILMEKGASIEMKKFSLKRHCYLQSVMGI